MELEMKLGELTGEMKAFVEKANAEVKALGTVTQETKTALEAVQTQVDAIDLKLVDRARQSFEGKTLEAELKENESVRRILSDKRGTARIDLDGKQVAELLGRKTVITSDAVGRTTSGVLSIDRTPGIVEEARRVLRVRDLLAARPTDLAVIDFVKVNSPMTRTNSPQTEGAAKFEQTVTFTTVSERVRTIAAWIPATRQILDDFSELMGFLQTSMPYYVNMEEEAQLVAGDGTGENLHGLATVATAFSTSLLHGSEGWNKIDVIGRTVQQIQTANEVAPTFAIVHPNDWWDMRLTKDAYGRYILGDPQTRVRPMLFDLDVVPTTAITAGSFLVGSGNAVATEIRDRMGMQIDISTEHGTFFTENKIAIRAEKRLALVTRRPGSFIKGTFTQSPAL